MKIALYIEDGREQIVLTPQTKTEGAILRSLTDGHRSLSVKKGSFYNCQGGWTRQGSDDESAIIVLDEPEKACAPGSPIPYPNETAEVAS